MKHHRRMEMSEQEIFEMADKCGIIPWTKHEYIGENRLTATDDGLDGDAAALIQFAHLIAAHEREECAKVCQQEIDRIKPLYSVTTENAMKVIRARGQA